jgi:hypothetical protein
MLQHLSAYRWNAQATTQSLLDDLTLVNVVTNNFSYKDEMIVTSFKQYSSESQNMDHDQCVHPSTQPIYSVINAYKECKFFMFLCKRGGFDHAKGLIRWL